MPIGSQKPAIETGFTTVYLPNEDFTPLCMSLDDPLEAKKVGTMVITKLK